MAHNVNNATAADFGAAAQKHANATWFWAFVAAAAGYFGGWGWAAVPGVLAALSVAKSVSATRLAHKMGQTGADNYGAYREGGSSAAIASQALVRAEALVNSYGKILGDVSGQVVADAALLPASKEAMKAALLVCIKVTPEGSQREQLKVGYLMLSSFQDGVGTVPHSELVAASRSEGEELWQELAAEGV